MDIVNIPASDWASPEIRTIVVSPNHIDAPFKFHVREFIPVEGDLLEEQWMTATGRQTIAIPRYALAEMHEVAQDMKHYIERHVSRFIAVTVGHLDELLWETYTTAFRHIGNAKVIIRPVPAPQAVIPIATDFVLFDRPQRSEPCYPIRFGSG
jgi:hypothetical protein